MNDAKERDLQARAIAAAQGDAAFDVLIRNGLLIDVATSEAREADIGIVGSLIASVHPRGSRADAARCDDVSGCYVAPGFIDTHVHFESSHMTPENYASVVVPQGTTTILFDPHELANVLGLEGVRYAIEAGRKLPLRMVCLAPSCVPSAPGLEMSGADFQRPEVQEMLSWPEIAGLAEVMDMNGVLEQNRRTMEILRAGLESGKIVEGHARGLSGPRLQGYAAAGISSDHELTSGEDGLEKLRAGLTIEIRGSHDYVLPGLVQVINQLPQVPSTVTVCTDDVPPDYLVENGGICDVLRRLVRYGMDPVQAVRCATLHASYRLRRPDLGLVAPGRAADLVILSDLRNIAVHSVFASGRMVAREGKMLEPLPRPAVKPSLSEATPVLLTLEDCRVPLPQPASGRTRIRVIKGARFTSWSELEVEVRDGYAIVPDGFGVMLVRHRHGGHTADVQRAVIEGWGELRGAIATTYSHDAHNLVVIGRSPEDLQAAANEVIAAGGGIAVAQNGEVIASLPLPVAGILSAEDPEQLARSYRLLRLAADKVVEWEPPYRVFKAIAGTALACNAGPHLTDLGLIDGTTGEIVSMLVGGRPEDTEPSTE